MRKWKHTLYILCCNLYDQVRPICKGLLCMCFNAHSKQQITFQNSELQEIVNPLIRRTLSLPFCVYGRISISVEPAGTVLLFSEPPKSSCPKIPPPRKTYFTFSFLKLNLKVEGKLKSLPPFLKVHLKASRRRRPLVKTKEIEVKYAIKGLVVWYTLWSYIGPNRHSSRYQRYI